MSSYYDDASLMLLASGGAQKDGKVYSVKPTDGSGDFTFTRGSNLSATRVDASQLIEKGRENLLLQSNQFDTTWSGAASITSGESGYDGTNDAWLFNNACTTCPLQQVFGNSGVQTFSAYFKKNASYGVRLYIVGTTNRWAFFNLSNGTIQSAAGLIDSNVEQVGTDWYRCSVTYNDTSNFVRFYITDNASTQVLGNITIQSAQLEQGLVATPYIETGATTAQAGILENTSRFDYSGGATCPSLLLEPSRSNSFATSEGYYNWSNTGATITVNQGLSPEGVNNAALFEATATPQPRIENNVANVSSVYSTSIFVKKVVGDYFGIGWYQGDVGNSFAKFNIAEGTFDGYTGDELTSADIVSYGNGWYRISVKLSTTSSTSKSGVKFVAMSSATSGAGNIGDQFLLYGAQLELGSYKTSYIPTYGVSQTRATDNCINSSLTTSTDFTIFFEAKDFCLINGGTTTGYADVQFVFGASGSAYDAGGSYHIYANSMYYYNGSTNTNFGVIFNNQTDSKFALVKRGNQGIVYANGVKKTEVTLPSGADAKVINWDTINLTSSLQDAQGDVFGSKYQQLLKFDTALSDLDLAILTGATTYNTFAEMALALNYTVYE